MPDTLIQVISIGLILDDNVKAIEDILTEIEPRANKVNINKADRNTSNEKNKIIEVLIRLQVDNDKEILIKAFSNRIKNVDDMAPSCKLKR